MNAYICQEKIINFLTSFFHRKLFFEILEHLEHSNKTLVSMDGIYKMFVRKTNRENLDQTASSEAV